MKILAALLLAETLLAAPPPKIVIASGKRNFRHAERAFNARHFVDARLAFEEVLRKKPRDEKAKILLGVTHYYLGLRAEESGDPARAAEELRAALQLDPAEPYWHLVLARELAKQGEAAGAARECAEAARLSPLDAGLAAGCGLKSQKSSSAHQAEPELPDLTKPRKGFTKPVPVHAPHPPYSDKALKLFCAGTTVLSVVVGANGSVESASVVKPLGLGLDEKALETVRTWTFKPATHDGKPVRARIEVKITFSLRR